MSVSSGDYPGVIAVSGNDSDLSAPGITYEQLQQVVQENSVDLTQTEYLLAGIDSKLSFVILFCTVFLVCAACRMVYKFFNGLFG